MSKVIIVTKGIGEHPFRLCKLATERNKPLEAQPLLILGELQ